MNEMAVFHARSGARFPKPWGLSGKNACTRNSTYRYAKLTRLNATTENA